MPTWTKISFQNRNSPIIEHLLFFHDHSIIILTIITIISMYLLTSSYISKRFNRYFIESQEVEIFWTIIPTIILIFIAIPSIKTLYIIEESINPILTIKSIGFQWYWGYEYSEFENLKFNSIITKRNKIRLIEVSNHLVIPTKTPTQIIITSKDVIHSWTIPSLGVKIDAIPGRLNQTTILINRPSIIVGQCSEICGAGHRFIPITLESPSIKKFKSLISLSGWVKQWPLKPINSRNTLKDEN